MRPESRKTQLLAQDVGDELVIYDQRSHEAHHLSPTAAVVWRAADGKRSLPELSALLRESLDANLTAETALSDEDSDALVRLALDELDRVGLLVRGLPGIRESMSRREMLGVTAALLPVVASIVAPTPAMAQTNLYAGFNGTYTGTGTPNPQYNQCNIGPGPVSMVLSLTAAGTGPLNITHTQAGRTFAYTVSVTSSDANRISVSGVGVDSGQPCDFTFTRPGPAGPYSATGHHDLSTDGTCLTSFNITANKP